MRTIAKYLMLIIISIFSYHNISAQTAKFQPPAGKKILILGQDLGAIGGFTAPNNNGYVDNLPTVPGGITSYTDIANLGGLNYLVNWGSGDVCAQCIVENEIYKNSVLVFGIYMVGMLEQINAGDLDNSIEFFADWVKDANRPVFLRIGYEFNASWANYDPSAYKSAFKRIVDIFRDNQVNNFATVWQSDGTAGNAAQLYHWYPGDNYVDWLGYSHFHNFGEGILQIADEKNKPVMIAEATPRGADLEDGQGMTHWNEWFDPLFQHIYENEKIMALAYINVDWDSQPMWQGQGWGDSRIQMDDYVQQQWLLEINNDTWLNSSDSLFQMLSGSSSAIDEGSQLRGIEIRYYQDQIIFKFKNFESANYTISLHDLQGKIVWQQNLIKPHGYYETKYTIDTPASGMYVVRVFNSDKFYSQKLII